MAHDLGRSPSNLNRRAVLGGVGAAAAVALRLASLGRTLARWGTPVASGAAEDYPEVVITATEYRLDLPASIPGGLTRADPEERRGRRPRRDVPARERWRNPR